MDASELPWLIGSIAVFAVIAWSWAGRTRAARWWLSRPGAWPIVLGILPFFAGVVFATSIVKLLGDGWLAPAGFVIIGCFVVVVLGVVRPRWWGPRWFHAEKHFWQPR